MRPSPDRETAEQTIRAALADPHALTPQAIAGLADHLAKLPADTIRRLNREYGQAGGRSREDAQGRLRAYLDSQRGPTAAPRLPQKVQFTSISPNAARVSAGLFGADKAKSAPAELLAAAASAADGARVKVQDQRTGLGDGLEISVSGNGYDALRHIFRDRDGKLFAHNSNIRIQFQKDNQGNWVRRNPQISGTNLFTNQVRAMRALGVKYVETYAARLDSDNPNHGMSGYYVWPRLGYDAEIPKAQFRKLPAALQAQVQGNPTGSTTPNSVLDLMHTPAGRAWWMAHGESLDAKFDLSDGSTSLKVLASYLAEQSIK